MECQWYDIMRREMFQTVSRYVDVPEKSFYLVIVIYQREIMKSYLKQFTNIFTNPKRFLPGN